MRSDVHQRLAELQHTIDATNKQRESLLESIATSFESWS